MDPRATTFQFAASPTETAPPTRLRRLQSRQHGRNSRHMLPTPWLPRSCVDPSHAGVGGGHLGGVHEDVQSVWSSQHIPSCFYNPHIPIRVEGTTPGLSIPCTLGLPDIRDDRRSPLECIHRPGPCCSSGSVREACLNEDLYKPRVIDSARM